MPSHSSTRSRIIEIAASIIDEHGESAVRIRDLAETVGVTQPSLYHHFANREAVLEAAHLHRFITKQDQHVQQFNVDARECNSQEEFIQVVNRFFDFAQSDESQPIREARITVMAGAFRRPTLMAAVTESLEKLIAKMSDTFMFAKSHEWVREDLDVVAFTYWLTGELTVLVFAETTGRKDLRPAISAYVRRAVFMNLGLPQH
jgi:AcrR family transcriptional regulator